MEIGMNASNTYTLYTKTTADERIIARGVSAVDAMIFIVEREPERRFLVTSEAYGTFRRSTGGFPSTNCRTVCRRSTRRYR
jgi:hypothetical protein